MQMMSNWCRQVMSDWRRQVTSFGPPNACSEVVLGRQLEVDELTTDLDDGFLLIIVYP
jgi:hypothetical protein